jgi:hypothetical protein
MPINKLVIISYANFLSLSNRSRQILSANDDFLVSINKEDYIKLSAEEKDKLVGVALTDEDHNAKIIEQKSLRKEISSKDLKFYLKDIQPITDVEVSKQSFMEKHKKQSKPYCPKKIFNKNYNSKKKGGR